MSEVKIQDIGGMTIAALVNKLNPRYYILCLERTRGGSEPKKMWWRPQRLGYTDDLTLAGKYPQHEAFEICYQSGFEDLPVPIEAMAEKPYS
jgi:hypothetical protein